MNLYIKIDKTMRGKNDKFILQIDKPKYQSDKTTRAKMKINFIIELKEYSL